MIINLNFESQLPLDEVNDFLVWKQKADQGDADAQYAIAKCYHKGKSVVKDVTKAFYYYQLAAEQGHFQALVFTAFCYEYGEGVKQSNQQAFHYYQLAAEQGHIGAQACLGKFYAEGRGIQQSHEKAIHYYRLAAEHGSVLALSYLADAYKKGLGVAPSQAKATFYLQQRLNHLKGKAAAGNRNAQMILKKHDDIERTMKNLLSDRENDSKNNLNLDSNRYFYQKLEEYITLEDTLFKKQSTLKTALRGLLKVLYRCFNFKIL